MSEERDPIAELMTRAAELVSLEIQPLLKGLGHQTQGAILADLVSLWLAGTWDQEELRAGMKRGPKTIEARAVIFEEWIKLVLTLVPESEKELMRKVEPEGHG